MYLYKCDKCENESHNETYTVKLAGLPEWCNYQEYCKKCADELWEKRKKKTKVFKKLTDKYIVR